MARFAVVRSARFRLALVYTVVVFGLAVLVIGVINFAFSHGIDSTAVTEELTASRISSEPGAAVFLDRVSIEAFETLANTEALARLRQMSIIALAVLFPASLVAGWFIAGRVLRPVGEIAGVARDIEATDLSRRIQLEGPDDELKNLADTFDAMLDRIERGVEDQRRFIQDISHELRNPLATMAMNLDLVLWGDPDDESQRETMYMLRRAVDRASRTVDGLTRFARHDLPEGALLRVDLSALAGETLEELRAPAEKRGIRLRHLATGAPRVRADRESLRSAIANLAGNAVRLAPEGSTVTCGAGALDGWAWMGVRDEGPGILEDDHRLIFQRNWGRDRSRLHSEKRTGLGLSIVRQVAEAGGGTVTLSSAPAIGSSFVIWIPTHDDLDPGELTIDGLHPVKDPLLDLTSS